MLPANIPRSRTLVIVDDQGVDIVNLRMDGILDKTGHIPLNGDELTYEPASVE